MADTEASRSQGERAPRASPRALLVTHPVFRRPGFGKHHPLSIDRQTALMDLIEAMGWLSPEEIRFPSLATRDVLERFHAPHYLDAFERAIAAGAASREDRERYGLGTMECPIFPGLAERAAASVGGAILAADLALAGHVAFHPGGGTHHGRPDRASGFCFLNDPVFAILRLLDGGLARVLYVDLDAHHGDGVQDGLAQDPRVTFLSIHEEGRWPGTGALDDRLGGRAFNMPVPRGLSDGEHAALVDGVLRPLIARFAPQGIVVTLGADALAGDPLSAMGLSNRALWSATEACVAAAPHVVIVGGGGYNPWTTARLWAGMWARLSGRDVEAPATDAARAALARLTCDLVDEEDMAPHWLTSIADPAPDAAPLDAATLTTVRPRIREIVAALAP